MRRNNIIKPFYIVFICSIILNACAGEPMQSNSTSILDKINTLAQKKPSQLQDIENTLGIKFDNIVSSEYFNTATASKKELEATSFLSIEYKYGFQKENPQGKLIISLTKSICFSKEDTIRKFGKDYSRYIPTIHHWSKKTLNNPYKEIVEYYDYEINKIKFSIGFPVDPKTGKPDDSSCSSKFIINFDG